MSNFKPYVTQSRGYRNIWIKRMGIFEGDDYLWLYYKFKCTKPLSHYVRAVSHRRERHETQQNVKRRRLFLTFWHIIRERWCRRTIAIYMLCDATALEVLSILLRSNNDGTCTYLSWRSHCEATALHGVRSPRCSTIFERHGSAVKAQCQRHMSAEKIKWTQWKPLEIAGTPIRTLQDRNNPQWSPYEYDVIISTSSPKYFYSSTRFFLRSGGRRSE